MNIMVRVYQILPWQIIQELDVPELPDEVDVEKLEHQNGIHCVEYPQQHDVDLEPRPIGTEICLMICSGRRLPGNLRKRTSM